MCLIFDRTEPTHCGERTVWKIMKIKNGQLRSIYFGILIWKFGLNQSDRIDRSLTGSEKLLGTVEPGFHVYTDFERAQSVVLNLRDWIIVKMVVHSDDFVAEMTEWDEAVYTEATIDKEEWDKINLKQRD